MSEPTEIAALFGHMLGALDAFETQHSHGQTPAQVQFAAPTGAR